MSARIRIKGYHEYVDDGGGKLRLVMWWVVSGHDLLYLPPSSWGMWEQALRIANVRAYGNVHGRRRSGQVCGGERG